jgi:TPR repeat protein
VRLTQPAADFNRALHCGCDADAFAYLLKAAEEGCVRSQFLVGLAYHIGRGAAVDYERAGVWYRRAACSADSHAIANLGIMRLLAQDGPADDIEAYTWLQSAVGLGHDWLRPAVEFLEDRISGRGNCPDGQSVFAGIAPAEPSLRTCTLPGCDRSRCKAI